MREVRGIAEADQLHCDILIGDAASDGGVWGGQDARGADSRSRIAERYTVRMIWNHRRRIHSIPPRLHAIFTVTIALRRRQRLLVAVWAMGGTGKR